MSFIDTLKIATQYVLPKHLLSRGLGCLADREMGWLTTQVITWFIKRYNVDMNAAKYSLPQEYRTFNEFFTRELKEDQRPITQDAQVLVHPVDGTVSQCGLIEQGRIFQRKVTILMHKNF